MTGAGVWWIAGGFIAIGAFVIWLIIWSDARYPRETMPLSMNSPTPSPTAAPTRRTVKRQPHEAIAAIAPLRLQHGTFAGSITVSAAHKIMQEHLDCSATRCPRKRQARDRLAAAGKIAIRARPRDRLAGAPTDIIPVTRKPR